MKKLIFLISISLCFALTNHYSLRLKEDQPWVEFTNHLIVSAQTPLQITSISDNRSTYQNSNIPLYEKLEISFQVNGSSATNLQWPYDPNPPAGITPGVGISVEAEFTHDNWRTIYKVPAFYYQEYQPPQVKNNQDWFYPNGNYSWRVRFAPTSLGQWQYRLTAQDANGSTTTSTSSFTVVNSTNKGFVRPSATDPRYFEFSDGTYFPGLGYNLNFDQIDWKNPIQQNASKLQIMGQNGIQFIRIWLSQWQIFGEQWNGWKYPHDASGGLWSHLRYSEAYPGSEVSMRLSMPDGPPCMSSATWLSAPIALKQNTSYRVKARVKTIGLGSPVEPGKPYGFAVKTGQLLWMDASCEDPDQGTRLTNSLSLDSDWTTVEGIYNSGNRNFLDGIFVTLENVNSGEAYIDYVWMEENVGSWGSQPNILEQPWMAHHQYYDQRMSYAFDVALGLAEQNRLYLKPVLTEKNDWILNSINSSGNFINYDGSNNNNFYGSWKTMTKTRWLLNAWWRYVQARWGYSTSIHSWELLNEGDPWNSLHYTLADEFGKYMHCGVFGQSVQNTDGWKCSYLHLNSHPVTTSNWHSYPVSAFWNNSKYPNVDIADFHLYYQKTATSTATTDRGTFTISTPATWYDTALVAKTQSDAIGALTAAGAGKPTVVGESGFVNSGSQPGATELYQDTQGVWLHNYLWAGIAASGAYNAGYWYSQNSHIYCQNCSHNGVSYSYDNRDEFGNYYRFIKDLPLNNGHYTDAGASSSSGLIRAWGQKDSVNGRAHLWLSNSANTWIANVNHAAISPVSGSVTIDGFTPNQSYPIEWWNTYTSQVSSTGSLSANSNGEIILAVNSLSYDVAVTNGDYSQTPTPTPLASPQPTATPSPIPVPGDANGDTHVDGLDSVVWLNHYNTPTSNGSSDGDFSSDGNVDGLDYVIWLNNYGR